MKLNGATQYCHTISPHGAHETFEIYLIPEYTYTVVKKEPSEKGPCLVLSRNTAKLVGAIIGVPHGHHLSKEESPVVSADEYHKHSSIKHK